MPGKTAEILSGGALEYEPNSSVIDYGLGCSDVVVKTENDYFYTRTLGLQHFGDIDTDSAQQVRVSFRQHLFYYIIPGHVSTGILAAHGIERIKENNGVFRYPNKLVPDNSPRNEVAFGQYSEGLLFCSHGSTKQGTKNHRVTKMPLFIPLLLFPFSYDNVLIRSGMSP